MSRIDCMKKNTYLDGSLVIEGHDYVTYLAVYDRETDRTYVIDECSSCGKRQASFCNGRDPETIKQYPQFVQVGSRQDG